MTGSAGIGKTALWEWATALTAAQASQITGTKFATTKPNSTAGQVFGCDYATGDSALLQVSVTVKDGKIGYDADLNALKTAGFPPNSVTGVGDEAFSAPGPRGTRGPSARAPSPATAPSSATSTSRSAASPT